MIKWSRTYNLSHLSEERSKATDTQALSISQSLTISLNKYKTCKKRTTSWFALNDTLLITRCCSPLCLEVPVLWDWVSMLPPHFCILYSLYVRKITLFPFHLDLLPNYTTKTIIEFLSDGQHLGWAQTSGKPIKLFSPTFSGFKRAMSELQITVWRSNKWSTVTQTHHPGLK